MQGLALSLVAACAACSPTHREEPARPERPAGALVVSARDAAPPSADAAVAPDAAAGDAAAGPAIVDAPMAWSETRARLTLDYRRAHSDPEAADLTIVPRVIVLHYTGGSSAAATRNYFDQVRIEASRKELARAGAVNVSSHFVVERDGTIYQLQPVTRFARHCIGLNHVAIGIENVGDEDKFPLTEAQVTADAALIRMLVHAQPITHLLGHHEVMAFRAHPYYVELDRAYKNDKPDPGRPFMAKVRARVEDLGLAGLSPAPPARDP